MTLLLAHAARYGVIHVSDRLLTIARPTRPFDKVSNKVLVYLCSDAVVAIAYTGIAYVGTTPTDVWIAEQLIEQKIQDYQTFGLEVKLRKRNISAVIDALRDGLEKAVPAKDSPKVELLIAGWKWGRTSRPQRPQPFVAVLFWNGKNLVYVGPPRYWWFRPGRDEALCALPFSNMARIRLQEVMKQVNSCPTGVEMRDVLVNTIRAVSSENATVGEDCMSVMIPPPHQRIVEIQFLPGPHNHPHEEVYTPWVITPGYIHKPSVLFGGWEIHSGDWTIYFRDKFKGFAAFAKQPRPKRP